MAVERLSRYALKAHLGWDYRMEANGESVLASYVAPGSTTFLDVGANLGDWTAMFLESSQGPDCVGVLFDPSQEACVALRHRFSAQPRIEVVEAAVSDHVSEATFFEEPNAGPTSSLFRSFSAADAIARTVAVTTIDAELDARGIERVDVLKVDAEGCDLLVLKGAERLLTNRGAGVVQFEYNEAWRTAGGTLEAAVSLLDGYGYRVFLLRADGLYRIPVHRLGELFHYMNFIAVSPEWSPRLAALYRGPLS